MANLLECCKQFIKQFTRPFRLILSQFFGHHAAAPASMFNEEQRALVGRLNELEATGRHEEVIKVCESAINGSEIHNVHFALSRSCFALAAKGNEIYAWPALLAALDGIERQFKDEPNILHVMGICRWVLDLFADRHRMDVPGFLERLEDRRPAPRGIRGNESPETGADGVAQPMYELSQLEAFYRNQEYVNLGNALLTAVPTVLRQGRSEEWVVREVRYLFANVVSPLAGEKVAELLSADDFPMPGDYEAQHYERYLLTAAYVRRQQLLARGRGVPSILLTTLPKSASAFLCYTLAEVMGAAITRVSIGNPLMGAVYAKWVAMATQGGCVTHDHFAASELNLAALRVGTVQRIVVLVRDPRSVFWSLENTKSEWDKVPPATRMIQWRICRDVGILSKWIDSWIQAKKAGFPVTIIRFKNLTADPATVMEDILRTSGASGFIPRLHELLRRREEQKQVSPNFRRGDDDAWRAHVPAEMHAAIWDLISVDVRDLLDLAP